jgi:hypothetical protein
MESTFDSHEMFGKPDSALELFSTEKTKLSALLEAVETELARQASCQELTPEQELKQEQKLTPEHKMKPDSEQEPISVSTVTVVPGKRKRTDEYSDDDGEEEGQPIKCLKLSNYQMILTNPITTCYRSCYCNECMRVNYL